MDKATLNAVMEAVRKAIVTELRGYQIYKAAAEKTTDPDARRMFESLANDERSHKEFLEQNYQGLLQSGEWTVPATAANLTPDDHSEIITEEFLHRVKGGEFEMAVVAAGVELERSAIEFYRAQAMACPDERARATFHFLADWEKGHLESLTDLDRTMRDSYFAQRGFAPM